MSRPNRRVVVGLGANLGDREATIRTAIERISQVDGVRLERVSTLRQTAPIGPEQPDFLNGAIALTTTLEAVDVLRALLDIERALGRRRDPSLRWGPRVIDLDVLWVEGESIESDELTVPHPRLHERRFALEPLVEVAEDATEPRSGARYRDMLAALCRNEEAR
ncbi:MAG: 2-amino-4-hydroxy-6-hydroxymethyldihydropteridine diphosphokinase [Polyangiaceae bacterium]